MNTEPFDALAVSRAASVVNRPARVLLTPIDPFVEVRLREFVDTTPVTLLLVMLANDFKVVLVAVIDPFKLSDPFVAVKNTSCA